MPVTYSNSHEGSSHTRTPTQETALIAERKVVNTLMSVFAGV